MLQNTLRAELMRRNKSLHDHALQLISHSNQLTPHSIASFPTGTNHGPAHTATIELIGDLVLSNDVLPHLNDFELFNLLLAYYFHDLGMVGTETRFETPEGRDQIRREHAVAIGMKICDRWQQLGFANRGEAEILAQICKGHRPQKDSSGHANWDSLDSEAIVGPGSSVRVRLVSALIYGIDELHLGADRAEERLQDWLDLKSDEPRRHWTRHQSVHGPNLSVGCLAFSVSPATPAAEDDLRRNVFVKACRAYQDMRQALADAGITASVPELEIRWKRDVIWRLLIIESEKAAQGATASEIMDEIVATQQRHQAGFLSLDDLCKEVGNQDHSIREEAARAVGDYETTNVLVRAEDSGALRLATTAQEYETILKVLRNADEVDRLFAGVYSPSHELSFYREHYGARFVKDQVQPLAQKRYGVDVCYEGKPSLDSSIGQILRVSPTSARLVRELNPIASDLVKRRLLCLAVITGLSRDLYQSPELILNAKTRKALYEVSEILKTFEKSYQFFEELALLSGLTEQQIAEMMVHSADWQKEMRSERLEETTPGIELKQRMSKETYRPSTAFPYLLLAGQRSRAAIQFQCNYGSSISLSTPTPGKDGGPPLLPVSIGVEPGPPSMVPKIDFKCELSMDKTGKQAMLVAYLLNDTECVGKPIIVRLPSPDRAKEGKSTIQFAMVFPDLTVGHLQRIVELQDLCHSGGPIELQLILGKTGERIASMAPEQGLPFNIPSDFRSGFIQRLNALDSNLPAPWFCSDDVEHEILQGELDTAREAFEAVRQRLEGSRPDVTTFTLVTETEQGVPYRQDFLGFFPGLTMSSPKVEPGGQHSQDNVDKMWNERAEMFKLESALREDVPQITESFRQWAQNPELDKFPVNVDSSIPTFHQIKTIFALERYPRINRFWYTEEPTIVRVRPATRREQLEIERKYWESRGDEPRCALIDEMIARIDKNTDSPSA